MEKAVGTGIFLALAVLVWSMFPVVAITGNALFRPHYQVRDLATEYRSRLLPNRVRWYDYRMFSLVCPGVDEQRVVLLHTTEFLETPLDFLTRNFPDCRKIERVEERIPSLFSGILVGRW
jgi:hypothetical protein